MDKIADYPIGKLIDLFGFILEDNGYKEITSKNHKLLKLYKITIGDDTLFKIDITLWEPFAEQKLKFLVGDLIVIKNCRIHEFNGKKQLSTINSSEIRNTLDKSNDKKMLNFYKNHKNVNEYKDIQGEGIINKNFKTKSVFSFIKEVMNTFDDQIENKNR